MLNPIGHQPTKRFTQGLTFHIPRLAGVLSLLASDDLSSHWTCVQNLDKELTYQSVRCPKCLNHFEALKAARRLVVDWCIHDNPAIALRIMMQNYFNFIGL